MTRKEIVEYISKDLEDYCYFGMIEIDLKKLAASIETLLLKQKLKQLETK